MESNITQKFYAWDFVSYSYVAVHIANQLIAPGLLYMIYW